MIFQALGARYTFGSAVKHLCSFGTAEHGNELRAALSERYNGKAVLYRKGRAALAEAIRIATGGSGSVGISALTCYSVVQAVEAAGCTPVYIDIREEDLHFGEEELSRALSETDDMKAVVVQNMLGIPADIAAISKVTSNKGIVLIEDLAHSAGAVYATGEEVGTVGDITMLSFGRDKAIDTVNGGALIVRPGSFTVPEQPHASPRAIDQLRDRLYPLIAWTTRAFYPVKIGQYIMAVAIKMKLVVRSADGDVNTKEALPNWQAKQALAQLMSLSEAAENRRRNALLYGQFLQAKTPSSLQGSGVAPARVPLLLENRDEVISYLKKYGVQANDVWYDIPVSPARFYKKVAYSEANNPVAVRVSAALINLPTHQRMTKEQIKHVSNLVNEVAK